MMEWSKIRRLLKDETVLDNFSSALAKKAKYSGNPHIDSALSKEAILDTIESCRDEESLKEFARCIVRQNPFIVTNIGVDDFKKVLQNINKLKTEKVEAPLDIYSYFIEEISGLEK